MTMKTVMIMIAKRCHQWRNLLIWYELTSEGIKITQVRTLNRSNVKLTTSELARCTVDLLEYHERHK
jgi:hypothetical protein